MCWYKWKVITYLRTRMESGGRTPRTHNICASWGTAVISRFGELDWSKEISYQKSEG